MRCDRYIHIGRIVLAKDARGKGLGQTMMQACLEYIKQNHPKTAIEMAAQSYLETFYKQFGFKRKGAPFDDGGVEHITMTQ